MASRKLKWGISGKGVAPKQPGEGLSGYEGPDLPKGSYPAKVKRMMVTQIQKKGENQGKHRIQILLEVQTSRIKGKEQYHGAPVWDGLNIIDSGRPYVNAFLHALTDGSERAKRAIESVFWDEDKGCDFKKMRNKRDELETHIVKIGRVPINSPKGEFIVQIVTRPGRDNKGNYRPEVAEYLPYTGKMAQPGLDDEDEDYDDDDIEDDDDMDDEDSDDEDEDYDDDEDSDEDDDEDSEDDEDMLSDTEDGDEDEDEEPEPVAAGSKARRGKTEKPF